MMMESNLADVTIATSYTMLFILYRPSVNCIKLEEGKPCFCLRSDYLDSPRPLNAVDQTRLPIQQSSLQILFVADH